MRGRRPVAFRAFSSLVLVALAAATLACSDEQWKERLDGELTRIETGVAALDGKPATGAELHERVASLDQRLAALERDSSIDVGHVSGKVDLPSLTQDVSSLSTRMKKVALAKAPPSDKPPPKVAPATPAPPAMSDAKAEPKKAQEWPKEAAFGVTAKAAYATTGTWIRRWDFEQQVYTYDYWSDGYAVNVSVTLSVRGLPREIKSGVVRVEFHPVGELDDHVPEHVADVRWTAQNVIGNDSYKGFSNVSAWHVTTGAHWLPGGPRSDTAPVAADAWLVSAVTKEGREITFERPASLRPK
jgi:hypothetical protein